MSAEAEKIIQDVQNVENRVDENGDVRPATRFFTYQERVDRQVELDQIDEFLNQPPEIMRTLRNITPQRLNELRNRRKRLARELIKSSAPDDLSGATKDRLHALERELASEIREGMPDLETMRKNPTGAVDWNLRWQRAKKAAILKWKNVRRALRPDSEDKDLANVEYLRPAKFDPEQGRSIFMGDAERPGHISYSHIPDEQWEASGLPLVNENSPLAQMERRDEAERIAKLQAELEAAKAEAETLRQQKEAFEQQLSKSEANRAIVRQQKENREKARQRMKEYWAKKKAGEAVDPPSTA